MVLASDAGGAVLGDPSFWINLGVAGVFLLAFAAGRVLPQSAVEKSERLSHIALEKVERERDRVLAERDHAAAQRDAMAEVLQERLLPVVSEFIVTTKALLPVLQEVQQLQHMLPALREFIRKANEAGGQ